MFSFALWPRPVPAQGGCEASASDDVEYLIFWQPLPASLGGVENLVAKLGTTGNGKTRQLGLGAGIPFFIANELEIVSAIKQAFEIARRTNLAVHFNVDDHINWDQRPDLWNWYDPTKKGYNSDNRKNAHQRRRPVHQSALLSSSGDPEYASQRHIRGPPLIAAASKVNRPSGTNPCRT